MTAPSHDDLTFTLIDHAGRSAWLASDGRILPYIAGGDESAGDGGEGEGEGGDGTGQGSGSGETGDGTNEGGEGEGEGGEKLTLTQAELDRMIDKRLGRAKTKWESELSTFAEAENQTETQRLQAERDAADQRAAQVSERANQRLIVADAKVLATSKDHGVPAEHLAAFVKLADLSDVDVDEDGNVDSKALATAVKKTLDENPFLKANTNGGRNGASGGEFQNNNGTSKPGSLADAIAAEYS